MENKSEHIQALIDLANQSKHIDIDKNDTVPQPDDRPIDAFPYISLLCWFMLLCVGLAAGFTITLLITWFSYLS